MSRWQELAGWEQRRGHEWIANSPSMADWNPHSVQDSVSKDHLDVLIGRHGEVTSAGFYEQKDGFLQYRADRNATVGKLPAWRNEYGLNDVVRPFLNNPQEVFAIAIANKMTTHRSTSFRLSKSHAPLPSFYAARVASGAGA
jgi:hypothetical protein